MQGKKSFPGAEMGADARGGRQLRWKASRYSPLCISVFLVLLLLFYSLSVFRSLLLLAIMEREGSCWSRFERDSTLLLVLGEGCCLKLGLWRSRVTDGVVWSLFFCCWSVMGLVVAHGAEDDAAVVAGAGRLDC